MVKPHPGESSSNGFSFDKAVITLHSTSSGPSNGDLYDNRNSSISYTGQWSELNDTWIPLASAPAVASYHQTQVAGSTASLEFYGDMVIIEGPLGRGAGSYDVLIDGTHTHLYNASSWWPVDNTVLYYQSGLNPNKKHTIALSNQGYNSSTLGLHKITVLGSQGRKCDKSLIPLSGIIGGAIGGYLVLQLCLVALFLYCRKRYRPRNRDQVGQGDLEGMHKPKQQYWHEFEILSPVSERSIYSKDTNMESLPQYVPPNLTKEQ